MSKREFMKRLQAVKSAERLMSPNPEWVKTTRTTLVQQVQNTLPVQPMPMPSQAKTAIGVFARQLSTSVRGPVLAVSSAIAAILGGSLFSVNASERSLPGDTLYPVKIATEQTKLALTSKKTDKLKLKTEYVTRRVNEIKAIANNPNTQSEVKKTAETLKRDLTTIKETLKEASTESSASEMASAAKLVDETTTQVATDLKDLKTQESLTDVKKELTEAQVAAVDTSVNAIATLVEAQKSPEANISQEEIAKAVTEKIELVKTDLTQATDKLNALPASTTETVIPSDSGATMAQVVTASSSAEQITNASTTLSEATKLIEEQKLDEATEKIVEAATSLIEVDSSLDLVASSAPVTEASTTLPVTPSSTSSTTE